MNIQWFLDSLPIMGKGMVGVFIAILVIYGLVELLNRVPLGGRKKKS